MGGLIMVFACQLRLHSISNAISEILASLRILKVITPRWSMAKNCHDVLSWLLESIRKPAGSLAPSNVAPEQYENRRPSQVQTLPRGEKRPRDDQPPYSPKGPECRRVRLSSRNSPWPQWAAPDSEDHTQLLQPDAAGFDNFAVNYQPIGSATNTDPHYAPAIQHSDLNSRLPVSFINQNSIQAAQQTVSQIAPSFMDAQINEWNETSRIVPAFNPPPNYDVFDGAMWGSLLEIVEPNW